MSNHKKDSTHTPKFATDNTRNFSSWSELQDFIRSGDDYLPEDPCPTPPLSSSDSQPQSPSTFTNKDGISCSISKDHNANTTVTIKTPLDRLSEKVDSLSSKIDSLQEQVDHLNSTLQYVQLLQQSHLNANSSPFPPPQPLKV